MSTASDPVGDGFLARAEQAGLLTINGRFPLGQVVATPGALELTGFAVRTALARHKAGDWGDLDHEDKQANEDAIKHGSRILSSYKDVDGTKFWIITEADRSSTTVLLPDEY